MLNKTPISWNSIAISVGGKTFTSKNVQSKIMFKRRTLSQATANRMTSILFGDFRLWQSSMLKFYWQVNLIGCLGIDLLCSLGCISRKSDCVCDWVKEIFGNGVKYQLSKNWVKCFTIVFPRKWSCNVVRFSTNFQLAHSFLCFPQFLLSLLH